MENNISEDIFYFRNKVDLCVDDLIKNNCIANINKLKKFIKQLNLIVDAHIIHDMMVNQNGGI